MSRLVVIAGEVSGDAHAARLIQELKNLRPDLEVWGTGGAEMQKAGVNLFLTLEKLNFMGFVEVVRHLPQILRNFRTVKEHIRNLRPPVVILVDYPGFNLRLARWCHGLGIPVVYYIAPQVWAWKESRVRLLRKYCRMVLCILPFEESYFRQFGVNAYFVGHPLAELIPKEFPSEQDRRFLALFPGSRPFEIRRLLPRMLEAARLLGEEVVLIARPTGLSEDFYTPYVAQGQPDVRLLNPTEALMQARYAFVKSGTSTLLAALFNVPQLVCYRGHFLSYLIARHLVRVPYVSLVNLISGKPVVQELLQHHCTVQALCEEGQKLRDDTAYREAQKKIYQNIRMTFASHKASQTAARLIAENFLS
ncbi:MAG: lipid-A-disaccharide synthase [Flavobacteriales bacterium]|nr:lipid-A-disaccharide synthase [Flavobacteriales bacterium]